MSKRRRTYAVWLSVVLIALGATILIDASIIF